MKSTTTNKNLLRSYMALKGITGKELASKAGISEYAFSKKMCGKSEWKSNEISVIKEELCLNPDTLVEIFF